MKRALLLLAWCVCLQAAQTTITDTIKIFNGGLFTGRVMITAPAMTTAGGVFVSAWQKTYTITDGTFSAALEPNDTAVPANTSYAVRFFPASGTTYLESWVVPTSATPLTIGSVRVSTVPTPALTFALTQLSPTGASKGDLIAFGTSWGRLAVGTNDYVLTADSTQARGLKWALAGGGTWGSITGAIGLQTDLASALAAKAALSHAHAAADTTSGVFSMARLASSGTCDATTFLRGDGTCQTASGGISSLNSLTGATQTFGTGTTGTDFNIASIGTVHTFHIPTASATNRGAVSAADWTAFNAKESALTFSPPLARSTNTVSIPVATSSVNGYLSSIDWAAFNAKLGLTGTATNTAILVGDGTKATASGCTIVSSSVSCANGFSSGDASNNGYLDLQSKTSAATARVTVPDSVTASTWLFQGASDTVVGQASRMTWPAGSINGIAPTRKTVWSTPTGPADNDLYTAPAGKRALILSQQLYNTTGSNILSNYFEVKNSGVYQRISQSISVIANSSSGGAWYYVIVIEPGESFSFNAAATGLNVAVQLIEFDATFPLHSPRLSTFAVTDNTLYAVPANKTAVLFWPNPGTANTDTFGFNSAVSVPYVNATGGAAITVYVSVTPNGGSIQKRCTSTSVSNGTLLNISTAPLPSVLNAGDAVSINSSATTAGQYAWLIVYEY